MEQQIDEIIDYVDSCKYTAFSSSKVQIDKDRLMDMLSDLKGSMPEELDRYRRVISERDRILEDARKKATALVDETQAKTQQMLDSQPVLQEAYEKANEVMRLASQHAQKLEDEAVTDANNYRLSAVQYMDSLLAQAEQMAKQAEVRSQAAYEEYERSLADFIRTVTGNRGELARTQASAEQQEKEASAAAAERASASAAAAPAAAQAPVQNAAPGKARPVEQPAPQQTPGGMTAEINRPESSVPESTGTIPQQGVPDLTGALNLGNGLKQ